MPCDIVMPQLGLTMTEGSVTVWFKKIGEWVERGEPLFTVQTDKVDMEVESMGSGYLNAILVPLDQTVPVGTVIATLIEQPPNPQAQD
jgi:pyruvate dehydrogenase E2 component (dihydrolipoyllysine-residue acetyltransferase)